MVQFLSLCTSSSSSLLHCILNMTQWLLYTGQEQDHCMVSLSLSKHAVTWEADYIRCKLKLNDLSSHNRWCKFWQHHLFAAKCILFLINWLKIYTIAFLSHFKSNLWENQRCAFNPQGVIGNSSFSCFHPPPHPTMTQRTTRKKRLSCTLYNIYNTLMSWHKNPQDTGKMNC